MSTDRPGGGRDSGEWKSQLSAARKRLVVVQKQLDDNEAQLAARVAELTALYDSRGYRLLEALSRARRSWKSLLMLPVELARALSHAPPGTLRSAGDADRPSDPGPRPQEAPTDGRPEGRTTHPGCLRIATIVDEFTETALRHECELVAVGIDWRERLDPQAPPDMLFVESAWRGSGSSWRGKLAPPATELIELLDWCADHDVPTVFWNKEDPIHFELFLETARHFDHVFTTDSGSVSHYRERIGRAAGVLPFACEPAIHNPMDAGDRKRAFCFAGSYYRKYEQRCLDFEHMARELKKLLPLEIMDRNTGRNDPQFDYPDEFASSVVGSMPAEQMHLAYKAYQYGVNLNTVTDSETMCARRVFDLMASNTPVVSNASRAIEGMFGHLVPVIDRGKPVPRLLADIVADEGLYKRHRLEALRLVLAKHTWRHRLQQLRVEVMGRDAGQATPGVAVFTCASTTAELDIFVENVRRQSYGCLRSFAYVDPSVGISAQGAPGGIESTSDADQLLAWLDATGCWVAYLDPRDVYSANYILDQALATSYSSGQPVGKSAYYSAVEPGGIGLRHSGAQYRTGQALHARRTLLPPGMLTIRQLSLLSAGSADEVVVTGYSIDEFNYCENLASSFEREGRGRSDWLELNV